MPAFKPFSINIKGRLHTFAEPVVMGILNVTTDSFYAPSRAVDKEQIKQKTRELIDGGAQIIDIGAYSSRPGSDIARTSVHHECEMLARGMEALREVASDVPVSVDTFRAEVARKAVTELSADIINDISGLNADREAMLDVLASTHAPYILMHMRGTPDTMQTLTDYGAEGVAASVLQQLSRSLRIVEHAGIADVIIDPGFGFGKTVDQNFELMRNLPLLCDLGYPVLVGISRKSMITKPLGITAEQALAATTALNTYAAAHGASILRVHDTAEATQAIKIAAKLYPQSI